MMAMMARKKRTQLWLFAAALTAMAVDMPLPHGGVTEAEAIVGRPMTPGSMAGVARRTTRRTVGVAAVGTAAVVGTAAYASRMYALPSGCVQTMYGSSAYYNCQGTYYRPMYDGPDVVYVQEAPPQ